MRRLIVVVVAVVALGGCKKFDADRFVDLCAKGSGVDSAAAYDPASPAAAEIPIAFVERFAESKQWVANVPSVFGKAGIGFPTADTYTETQLAFCVEQQPGAFDRDCGMDDMNATIGLGGAETKVKATGKQSTIKAYGSHYVLSVREAKTGRVVAVKEVDVKVAHCPLITLGPSKIDYATISDQALVDAFGPLLPKAVAARLHPEPAL